MTGLLDRLKAGTPEEVERRRFGLWALVALIVLLPLWWIWGADLMVAALRPLTGLMFSLFGLPGDVRPAPDGGWIVATGLAQTSGAPHALMLGAEELRRFLLSFPFFAALMIAPPRAERLWKAALIGAVVLIALFLISVPLYVWGTLAPMLNPALAPDPSATSRLVAAPLNPAVAQVALIGRYIGVTIAPFFAAFVLWAVLNPRGRTALLGEITG